MDTHALHLKLQWVLLALQQLAVGSGLHIQGQLDIHALLVLTQLLGHVLVWQFSEQLPP